MSLDQAAHWAELVGGIVTTLGFLFVVAPVAWKANRFLNRWLDMLKDFPMHRHTAGGGIIFPKGYDPPAEKPLMAKAND